MKKLLLTLLFSLFATNAFAQASLLPNGEQQFIDGNGAPYASGKVYFYVPTTSTPKNTWQDSTESTLNTNPVTLDPAGRAVIYGAGSYRQVLKDSLGNTVWDKLTQDPAAALAGGSLTLGALTVTGASTLNTASFSGIASFANGTAALPSVAFTNSLNTGLYHVGAGVIGISSGGLRVAQFTSIASSVNYLQFESSATGNGVHVKSKGSDTNVSLIMDSQGQESVNLAPGGFSTVSASYTANAVNYWVFGGGATGNQPGVSMAGSDTNIGMAFLAKGTGQIDFRAGGGATNTLSLTTVASAVNSLSLNAQATGSGPSIQVIGNDTNIDLNLYTKGAGNFAIVTSGGTARQLEVTNTNSAVNYHTFTGGTSGNAVVWAATGANSDINMQIIPKGSGNVICGSCWANSASATALHVDSNGLLRKTTSSKRYKDPAGDYTRGLDYALRLHPVMYTEKSDTKLFKTVLAGLYAEDVAEAGMNEFVYYGKDGRPESLHYENMVTLLINAVKELKTANDNQQSEIDSLNKRLTALEGR